MHRVFEHTVPTLKGIVHLKKKNCHPLLTLKLFQTCMNFFCWTQKKIFQRMSVTRQLIDPIDFHSVFFLLWKSVGSINCLVTVEEINSYRFERICIFKWTIPL